ncbi:hypothetical protein M0802_007357 [Mischocyttarus mexicanus]|nr:hypothetical protein M0802_007357 [Mischocyttarus mexicanus]
MHTRTFVDTISIKAFMKINIYEDPVMNVCPGSFEPLDEFISSLGRFTGRGRRRTRHSGCRETSPSPNQRRQQRQNNNDNDDDDDDDDDAAAKAKAKVVVGQMSKRIRLDAFTRVQRFSLGKESPV